MSSTVKNMFPSAVVGRSFVLSILFLILVIALFFIPEIIHLQESILKGGGRKSQTASVSSYKVTEDQIRKIDTGKPALSALDRVLALVNSGSGYLESRSGVAAPAVQQSARGRLNIPGMSDQAPTVAEPDQIGVTWKDLRNPQVIKVVRKAREDVRGLARALGPGFPESRQALQRYQEDGLVWIIEGEKTTIPARDVLDQIERLDLDVTRALLKERVDRADYIKWSRISLGPLSEKSRATRLRQEYLSPYNPRITLAGTKISVGQPRRRRDGSVVPAPSSVNVVGFVMGKDTQRLVLYRNGRRIRNIPFDRHPDDQGKRVFKFSTSPASGAIAIQASDGLGVIVQKTYRFASKVASFPRGRGGKRVLLPFHALLHTRRFDINDVDLRMDRFFRESIESISPGYQGSRVQK